MKNDGVKQFEDIIETDDNKLSLGDIESIANDEKVRQRYENTYSNNLYSTILLSLTHKSFPKNEAILLWNKIINHMKHLNHILGRNVGVAVASLDYLSNVRDKLSEPKIIEENKSDFITEKATTDELTKLYLRDVFNVVLKKEFYIANRTNKSLCLLMIDIDDFKKVNDTYGHLKGDEVLHKIGSIVNKFVRKMDLAARYGGEELAIIVSNTSIDQAYQVGERIRKTIEKMQFDEFNVTVSIGVSEKNQFIDTPKKLINAADSALYRAKREGKNQVKKAGNND